MLRNRGARKRRRGVTLVALALVASTLMVLIPAGSASAAFVQNGPRFLRSIGGSGRPGVFAWGVCYSKFSGEIFVTDYLNFQIRVYDKQGNHLRDFYRADPDGQPYSCAVDSDGSLFVAELKDNPYSNRIVKYDVNGNHLYDFGPSGAGTQYSVWLTVDDQGNLWAIDSHYWNTIADPPQISKYVQNATGTSMARDPLLEITVMPPDVLTDDDIPRLYGLDVISDGTIYVSDAWNRRVYRYAQATPEFPTGQLLEHVRCGADGRRQPRGRGQRGPRTRSTSSTPRTRRSTCSAWHGTYRFSFGSEGNGPGSSPAAVVSWRSTTTENVWVADFGGFEIEKYDWDGTPLLTAPEPVAGAAGRPARPAA